MIAEAARRNGLGRRGLLGGLLCGLRQSEFYINFALAVPVWLSWFLCNAPRLPTDPRRIVVTQLKPSLAPTLAPGVLTFVGAGVLASVGVLVGRRVVPSSH